MERPDLTCTLKALLGPGLPEIGCGRCFGELDRHVDLELAGREADGAVPGMRAHLLGCPACRGDHASLRALVGGEQAPSGWRAGRRRARAGAVPGTRPPRPSDPEEATMTADARTPVGRACPFDRTPSPTIPAVHQPR